MALFLSKRLLRFTVIAGAVIVLLLTLNSNSRTQQYIPSSISAAFDFTSGSISPEQQVISEENDAKKLEQSALNSEASEDSEAMDEESKALKAAAEKADAPIDTKTTMDYITPSFANKLVSQKLVTSLW